ncbi:coiled-coil domain-containing protein 146 [Leptopilina boulardi]|uniref:coiled-coil domain-containing protein 146 n=1 Tax=Leptopilina boulardi TaxID=63433 RepID=UPI0021F544AC|nr:coiled-coil domain-containing protein 146 [Leptopilina boulardi]
MRLPIATFVLLILIFGLTCAREITHEDIKSAMLSLVHVMRDDTGKLERHEARERQLGEELKKSLSLLTKKMTIVEGFHPHLMKLNDRVAGIEKLIAQRDERERIQMQKTADTLEDLEKRLNNWMISIENKISDINDHSLESTSDTNSQIISKLNESQTMMSKEFDKFGANMNDMHHKMKNEANQLKETIQNIASEVKNTGSTISNVDNSVGKIKEIVKNVENKPKTSSEIGNTLTEQSRVLARLKELMQDTSERLQELPRISELHSLHNETQMALQDTKHVLRDYVTRGNDGLESKIVESKEDIKYVISNLRMDMGANADRMKQELQDLEKGQSVMVSMADHVLDTKKRVEYGVHQILLEVGDLLKAQSANINNTMNTRFDGISNDIMDNQNDALSNLTTKMEQQMNQVWRQINVMYQQMMESAKSLDKLHEQNEVYVNGTTSTMGGMKNKVGEITKRMSEVDENLNYLLGRLSLVTQEFNQIKSGLGAALDNIKASFKEVQEKANDLTPGPHQIPENYKELDESKTDPEIVK